MAAVPPPLPPDAPAASALQRHDMLALLLHSTEEGVWFIDNELRTTDANPAMCRMLGVTREQMLGRTIYEFVDDENAAVFREQVQRRARGEASSYEIALLKSDGSLVHTQNNPTPLVDAGGRKIGAVGMFTDVSALKRAAVEVRASESRFRSMADAAPAFIWQSDGEGNATWFNQRWLRCLNLTLEQALAANWTARLHPDDLLRCRAVFKQALASCRPFEVEFRLRTAGGAELWIADHGTPRVDGGAGFEGYVVYGWDITARKAAESALIAARDEAERANRAKSEFLSRMSHELRTPLNAVLGFAQLIDRDPAEPPRPLQRERVQHILRGGEHLLRLINEVLDLARVESGTLTLRASELALAPLLRECLQLVQPLAREQGVQIEPLALPDPPALLHTDPTRLRQVLLNLLSNAVKYNPRGGTVQLGAAWHERGLRIWVRDSGPGLTAEQQGRLFQAFERLGADASAVEGTGIGLALSKLLVDAMGGRIGVDSVAGAGSLFWVDGLPAVVVSGLPAASAAPAAHPPAEAAAAAAHRAPRRVLYIEDNRVNQIIVEGMLERLPGLELALASDPLEGLSQAFAAPPQLVLLDIQLPGLSGFEVLARLRADPRTAGVPVVGLSANAMPDDVRQALAAGFDDYLTKPLELQRFLQAVRALLDRGG